MTDSVQKTLAITLALLFIAIVLIAFVSGWEKQRQERKETETQTKVIQPSTTYVILESSSPTYSGYWGDRNHGNYEDYHNYEGYHNYYNSHYSSDFNREVEIIKDYSYYARKETRKDFLGDYFVEYQVYVLNKGNTGNYFTVTFNFENQQGFEYSEAITQYLRAGERKEFLYKDVQFERTEILSWSYKVERV